MPSSSSAGVPAVLLAAGIAPEAFVPNTFEASATVETSSRELVALLAEAVLIGCVGEPADRAAELVG